MRVVRIPNLRFVPNIWYADRSSDFAVRSSVGSRSRPTICFGCVGGRVYRLFTFPDAQNKRRSLALYALEELPTVGTGLVGRRLNGSAENETCDESGIIAEYSEKNVFIFSGSFH